MYMGWGWQPPPASEVTQPLQPLPPIGVGMGSWVDKCSPSNPCFRAEDGLLRGFMGWAL